MTKLVDSGFDWIREIPDHWRVEKFRYVFKESKDVNGSRPVGEMLSVSQYRGIVPKEYENDSLKRTDEELEKYRVVRPGQLVVNTMWLNHGGLAVSNIDGHVSPAYRAFDIRDDLKSRYANYLMRSSAYIAGYTKFLAGVRPNSLQMSREDLMRFPILVPPLDEQRGIAAYLDTETAKIDALIGKQEQLITTLEERRGALISRAVTRGLAEDRPFRDSGVEWLGDIPADWEVSRIGACVTERREIVSDTDFPALSVTKKGVVPQLDSAAKSDNSDGRKLIRKDDFVINSRSDRKGSSGVSDLDGSCSVVYTVLELNRFLPAFAHHLFRSQPFQEEFYRWGTGIVDDLWSTRYSSMKQIPVPMPDLDEQRRIADFLDRETVRIDNLRAQATKMIAILAERRQALISAAVTGKLEVVV